MCTVGKFEKTYALGASFVRTKIRQIDSFVNSLIRFCKLQ